MILADNFATIIVVEEGRSSQTFKKTINTFFLPILPVLAIFYQPCFGWMSCNQFIFVDQFDNGYLRLSSWLIELTDSIVMNHKPRGYEWLLLDDSIPSSYGCSSSYCYDVYGLPVHRLSIHSCDSLTMALSRFNIPLPDNRSFTDPSWQLAVQIETMVYPSIFILLISENNRYEPWGIFTN